jgi:hypothetical protein
MKLALNITGNMILAVAAVLLGTVVGVIYAAVVYSRFVIASIKCI